MQFWCSVRFRIYKKKSRIRETRNLSTDADSRTDTITFFHQKISGDGRVLIEETEFWWPSGTHFFSSGDCRWWTSSSRRQTGFALIEETEFWWQSRTHFFIRKLQVMDEFSSRRQSSDGRQEHIFSSGDCRWWTSSHRRDRVLMAVTVSWESHGFSCHSSEPPEEARKP